MADWKSITAGGVLILVLLNQGCAGKALATAGVAGVGAGVGAGAAAGAAGGAGAAAAAAAAAAAKAATRPQGQHFAKPQGKGQAVKPSTAVCTGASGLLAVCPVAGLEGKAEAPTSGQGQAPGCTLTMTMQPRTLHGVDADKDGRDDTTMMPTPGCS